MTRKQAQEYEEYVNALRAETNCGRKDADELARLARRHKRIQERLCCEDNPALDKMDDRNENLIKALCARIGCGVELQGDPRGCTVKLLLPSGKKNDWGNTGYCVPQ